MTWVFRICFFVLTHVCVFSSWKITALRWLVLLGSLHRLKSIRFWSCSSYQPWKFAKACIPRVWKNQPGWHVEIINKPFAFKNNFYYEDMTYTYKYIYIQIHIYICYLSSAAACRMLTTPHRKHIFSVVWRHLEWVTPKASRRHKERRNCFRAHILWGRVFVRCVSVFHSDSPIMLCGETQHLHKIPSTKSTS